MNRRFFLRLAGTAGAALLVGPVEVLAAKSAQDLAGEALDLLGAGRLDEALEILGRAKRLDPRDDRVRALLGRAYFQKGDAARALEEFRLAVRLNPEDTISRMMVDKITLFPLPPGGPASKESGAGRSSTLEREAKAERERLLAGKQLPGGDGPFRLLIDPGHGGSDPGAAGPGLRESDVALDVSLRLARVLEDQAKGTVEVFFTRVADAGLPSWARASLAGWYGADLLVSVHATRLPDAKVSGLGVFAFAPDTADPVAGAVAKVENAVPAGRNRHDPDAGRELFVRAVRWAATAGLQRRGADMAGRMVKALPPKLPLAVRPLGLAPLNLLATADAPAVFVETGFLSNPGDAAVLAGAEARQALAHGLAQAVLAGARTGDRP